MLTEPEDPPPLPGGPTYAELLRMIRLGSLKFTEQDLVSPATQRMLAILVQAESEQRPHKVSYRVGVRGKEAEEQIERLRRDLSQAGLSAKVLFRRVFPL